MTNEPTYIAQSGDYCSFGIKPMPAHFITHYRCDDYRDGTITDALTGKVVTPARRSTPSRVSSANGTNNHVITIQRTIQ